MAMVAPRLPPALQGAIHDLTVDGVQFVLYAREARARSAPVLLVHSVNAAASAYEVRPIYEGLTASRNAYALELPGFGRADRQERPYTPRLMTDAIHAAVRWIRERHGGQPVDGLALSLSSEFLARAATERPDAFRSAALVSPTGLDGRRGAAGQTLDKPLFRRVVTCTWWRRSLFRGLTRPKVIRFFLRKTWGRKGIDEGLQDYCVQTTRVPGAEHAPLSFLSGRLFSADASLVYEQLSLPVWSTFGVRGDFADYGASESLRARDNWRMERFDTGALPHFEVPARFLSAYERFLQEAVA
jgi:hypothetical protein